MSLLTTTLLTLGKLGKGLVPNAVTKLLDVLLSTDSGNVLTFGTDNGICYIPAGLTLVKQAEFFTTTTLTSQTNGGWKKDAKAKWIVVIAVGGGASGSCFNSYSQTSSGGAGEPGAVEVYSGPASEFPATADVVIGTGGAAPTTVTTSVDGGDSQFGTLLLAKGGRGYLNYYRLVKNTYQIGSFLPRCSFRLGIPGSYTATTNAGYPPAEDSSFGPGAGSVSCSYGGPGTTGLPTTGVAGGAASINRPQSRVAGGAAISNPASGVAGNNGGNAVAGDPWSFGGGGGSGGYGGTGGNGGIPGGGGAGANNPGTNTSTYFVTPGAGGRGEVRVLTYG